MAQGLGECGVEGVKVCQMVSHSIGKGKPRDALCRKLACFLHLCILAISNRCQKTVPQPIRG